MADSPELAQQKATLRAHVRRRRQGFTTEYRTKTQAGLARPEVLRTLRQLCGETPIASYLALTTEPDLTTVHAHLAADHITCLLPRVGPTARTMDWVPDTGQYTTRERAPKVSEPLGPALPGTLWDHTNVALVPGLGVDRRGMRLGQGGGYYDTCLTHRPATSTVIVVLFDDEVMTHIPTGPYDQAVDAVLTGSSWLWVRSDQPSGLT